VAVSNVLQGDGASNIPDEVPVALAPFSNHLAFACLHQRTLAEAAEGMAHLIEPPAPALPSL
jgi:hypothetical protein